MVSRIKNLTTVLISHEALSPSLLPFLARAGIGSCKAKNKPEAYVNTRRFGFLQQPRRCPPSGGFACGSGFERGVGDVAIELASQALLLLGVQTLLGIRVQVLVLES